MEKEKQPTKVAYNKLYEFACKAESNEDFVERMHIVSTVIIEELANRLEKANVIVPPMLLDVIDPMNEEVYTLVDNINSTEITEDQHQIQQPLLIRLIHVYHPKMFKDYQYAKYVIRN